MSLFQTVFGWVKGALVTIWVLIAAVILVGWLLYLMVYEWRVILGFVGRVVWSFLFLGLIGLAFAYLLDAVERVVAWVRRVNQAVLYVEILKMREEWDKKKDAKGEASSE